MADVPKNKILNSTELSNNTFWVFYYGYEYEYDQLQLLFASIPLFIHVIRPYLNTTISAGLYDLRKIVSDRRFSAAKPTVLYVHGWEELLTQLKVEIIPRSYAARGGWNVILLNWDRIATGNYAIVWYNFIQVSGRL